MQPHLKRPHAIPRRCVIRVRQSVCVCVYVHYDCSVRGDELTDWFNKCFSILAVTHCYVAWCKLNKHSEYAYVANNE